MPLYNEKDLNFNQVMGLVTKNDAVSPNTTPVVPKTELGAMPIDLKPIVHLDLPTLGATPLNTEDIQRPDTNPNATGKGFGSKALSFEQMKQFLVKDDARPITAITIAAPADKNQVATELPSHDAKLTDLPKADTTPLNSEVLAKPDFNPNATIQTTPVKSVDVHPEVLPVVTQDIKGAEIEAKNKDDKYVNDGFGTTMNADGFGGDTHMNDCGCGGMKDTGFGESTFMNASGGNTNPKAGWYKLYWLKVPLVNASGKPAINLGKNAVFYFYGTSVKIGNVSYDKIKYNNKDYYVKSAIVIVGGAKATSAPASAGQPSPSAKTSTTKPVAKPTVLVVDANTFYVTTQASTVKTQDKKTGKTSNVVIAAKVMKNMGYKATVVIDTKRTVKVNGKTYYRVTKLKGNGGWESRVNSNPKLPTYWVLANDYTMSKDQSQAGAPMKAEGMYMDGVNGYGKPNTMYASGGKHRHMHDEGDEGLDLGTDGGSDAGDDSGAGVDMSGGDMGGDTGADMGGMDMQSQMDAVMIQAAQQNSMASQMQGNPLAAQQMMALSAMQQQQLMQQMQTNPAAVMQQMQQNPALMQQVQQDPALMQQMQQNPAMAQQVQQMQQMQPQLAGYDQYGNAIDQYGNLMTNAPAQTATTQTTTTTGQLPSGTQGQLTQKNTAGTPVQAGLAAGQVVSIYGNNGEFFNNGVNTQPYTLLIDTYYPVVKSDGTTERVPLPKGSTIWADAPFDYSKIAPEHKGSFRDPTDANNQFQRYSWASVDGVTINGGLIPMRKDTIVIDNVYTGQTMSAEGDNPSPAKSVTPSTPVAIGAYTDAAATTPAPFNWKKAAGIGVGVLAVGGLAYWWFKIRKKG